MGRSRDLNPRFVAVCAGLVRAGYLAWRYLPSISPMSRSSRIASAAAVRRLDAPELAAQRRYAAICRLAGMELDDPVGTQCHAFHREPEDLTEVPFPGLAQLCPRTFGGRVQMDHRRSMLSARSRLVSGVALATLGVVGVG